MLASVSLMLVCLCVCVIDSFLCICVQRKLPFVGNYSTSVYACHTPTFCLQLFLFILSLRFDLKHFLIEIVF